MTVTVGRVLSTTGGLCGSFLWRHVLWGRIPAKSMGTPFKGWNIDTRRQSLAMRPVQGLAFSFYLSHELKELIVVFGVHIVSQLVVQDLSNALHFAKTLQIIRPQPQQYLLAFVLIETHDANGILSNVPVGVELGEAADGPLVLLHASEDTWIVRQRFEDLAGLTGIG